MSQTKIKSHVLSTVVTTTRIIECISRHGEVTPNGVAKELNLSRSNAHRLIATLEELDLVEQSKPGSYNLTFKLFELGNTVPHRKNLIDNARPAMLRLSQAVGETVNNGILFQNEVLYIDKVEAVNYLKLDKSIGSTDPLHNTSLGKVLMAFSEPEQREYVLSQMDFKATTSNTITDLSSFKAELERVHERGVAFDLQELSMELNCVAAPVFDSKGHICSAISVSGPADRFDINRIQQVVPELQETVRQISCEFSVPQN